MRRASASPLRVAVAGQRPRTRTGRVGGLEPLDELSREVPVLRVDAIAVRQHHLGTAIALVDVVETPEHPMQARPEVVEAAQAVAVGPPVLAGDVDDPEPTSGEQRPQFLGRAVHELGAEFDRHRRTRVEPRVHPAADPLARLEHQHVRTGLPQRRPGGQAGRARPQHDDIPLGGHAWSSASGGPGNVRLCDTGVMATRSLGPRQGGGVRAGGRAGVRGGAAAAAPMGSASRSGGAWSATSPSPACRPSRCSCWSSRSWVRSRGWRRTAAGGCWAGRASRSR